MIPLASDKVIDDRHRVALLGQIKGRSPPAVTVAPEDCYLHGSSHSVFAKVRCSPPICQCSKLLANMAKKCLRAPRVILQSNRIKVELIICNESNDSHTPQISPHNAPKSKIWLFSADEDQRDAHANERYPDPAAARNPLAQKNLATECAGRVTESGDRDHETHVFDG